MLRPSVVCNVCTVTKWCILEEMLLLTAYRNSFMSYRLRSIGTKMSDLDLCLEIEVRAELGSKGPLIGNGLWRVEWSRDR